MDGGYTPFYVACSYGRLEVTKILLEDGRISPNKPNDDGTSPFYIASQQNHVEVAKLLVHDPRIDIDKPRSNGMTPFFVAAQHGGLNIVKWILASGKPVEIHAKCKTNNRTPSEQAMLKGHREVSDLILQFDANPKAVSRSLRIELGMSSKWKPFACLLACLFVCLFVCLMFFFDCPVSS